MRHPFVSEAEINNIDGIDNQDRNVDQKNENIYNPKGSQLAVQGEWQA